MIKMPIIIFSIFTRFIEVISLSFLVDFYKSLMYIINAVFETDGPIAQLVRARP